MLIDALALSPWTPACDVAGSRGCADPALIDALLASGATLVAEGERRVGRSGAIAHLTQGDGGAAVSVGETGVIDAGFDLLLTEAVDCFAITKL